MKNYELTCIVCPVGCRITAEVEGGDVRVSGNQCKRGELYCRQEVSCPVRTVTSLVAVEGGELPLCPVKTAQAVPKAKVPEVLAALRRVMADSEIGIVLMTEKLIDTCPAMVYRYKLTQKRPLIVEIPDRHGEGDVSQTIEKYVSEAIGVKL